MLKGGRTRWFAALLVGLALAGSAVVLVGTRYGPGISPDSVAYICAARNIVAGNGAAVLSDEAGLVLLPYHPPFYPMALAAVSYPGLDAVDAARVLAAALFAANVFLVGFVAYRLTGRRWLAAFVSLAVLSSAAAWNVHFFAWTEPLYIFLGLAGVATVVAYTRLREVGLLAAGALIVGLAILTRYDGAALIAAGAAALLFLGKENRKRRLAALAVFMTLSVLPAIMWLAAKYYRGGSVDARPIAFHPVTWDHVKSGIAAALAYSVPVATTATKRALILIAGAALLTTGFLVLRKRRTPATDGPGNGGFKELIRVAAVPAAYIASYISIYFFTITFVDVCVQMSNRTFLSVYVASLLLGAVIADYLWRRLRPGVGVRATAAAAAALFVACGLSGAVPVVTEAYRGGDVLEFTGEKWRESELVAAVGRLEPGTVVYSNAPDAIYIHTGRPTRFLPRKFVGASRLPNETYPHDLGKCMSEIDGTSAVIAYFDNVTWRWYLPTEAELVTGVPLRTALRVADGAVYESGRGRSRCGGPL